MNIFIMSIVLHTLITNFILLETVYCFEVPYDLKYVIKYN